MDSEIFLERINKNYAADYTEKAARVSRSAELLEAVIGLSGESGEVLDLIKKQVYYGGPANVNKIKEELGDVFHYFMRVLYMVDLSLDEVMEANLAKLKKRFPDGYSDAAAIARKDVV